MRPRLHLDSAPFTSFPSTVLLLDPASFFPLPLPPVSVIPSAVPSSPASLDSSAAVSVEASSAVDATWKERQHCALLHDNYAGLSVYSTVCAYNLNSRR